MPLSYNYAQENANKPSSKFQSLRNYSSEVLSGRLLWKQIHQLKRVGKPVDIWKLSAILNLRAEYH